MVKSQIKKYTVIKYVKKTEYFTANTTTADDG